MTDHNTGKVGNNGCKNTGAHDWIRVGLPEDLVCFHEKVWQRTESKDEAEATEVRKHVQSDS